MRVLITGGGGLIGTSLVMQLQEFSEIVVLDIKEPNNSDIEWIQGDIRNFNTIFTELGYIDGIVHLASVSRVITAEKNPLEAWSVNVEGTLKLLESIRNTTPWIIYGSSREVYGEPHKFPVAEDYGFRPINVYGVTKLAAERLVGEYVKCTSAKGAILRFSNVYGGVNDHETRVVPQFVRKAFAGESLLLNGRKNTFDFTHINDTVSGIVDAIKWIQKVPPNTLEDFNICTGRSTSLERLASLVIELTQSTSTVMDNKKRDYDVNNYCGDWQKAHVLLGYSPKVPIEEGLQKYIALMKSSMNRNEIPVMEERT